MMSRDASGGIWKGSCTRDMVPVFPSVVASVTSGTAAATCGSRSVPYPFSSRVLDTAAPSRSERSRSGSAREERKIFYDSGSFNGKTPFFCYEVTRTWMKWMKHRGSKISSPPRRAIGLGKCVSQVAHLTHNQDRMLHLQCTHHWRQYLHSQQRPQVKLSTRIHEEWVYLSVPAFREIHCLSRTPV